MLLDFFLCLLTLVAELSILKLIKGKKYSPNVVLLLYELSVLLIFVLIFVLFGDFAPLELAITYLISAIAFFVNFKFNIKKITRFILLFLVVISFSWWMIVSGKSRIKFIENQTQILRGEKV